VPGGQLVAKGRERVDERERIGEGVPASIVQPDMGSPAPNEDSQCEYRAAGMPDRSPGRLGDDRAEGICVEGLELGESLGAELSSRFLVRDDDERGGYAPIGARRR
jgi:hypothetical protein